MLQFLNAIILLSSYFQLLYEAHLLITEGRKRARVSKGEREREREREGERDRDG